MSALRLTDPVDARAANALVLSYLLVRRMAQSELMHTRSRPPLHYRVVPPPELGFVLDAEELKSAMDGRLNEASARYRYIEFARVHLGMAAMAVLAFPPDLTWRPAGPLVKPWTWITWSFFVKPRHRNLLSRFFSYMLFMRYRVHRKILTRYPVLEDLFDRKAREYTAKGYPETRARRLAWRDVHRVILGCTWLVATLEAYERGLIGSGDIVLPTLLERRPELADRLVQPGDLDAGYREYSWVMLLEAVGKR